VKWIESEQVVITGEDEIRGGHTNAFQDAVIRKIGKNPDPARRLGDRRSASDESQSSCNFVVSLVTRGSEDACGFGRNRNGRHELPFSN